ncbi:transcriptional antiterminator [Pseudomonas aeruginosa]|uniref:Rho-binding antiterminator n=1 Tax=Pseudomonas aeruginosa TaxID=287 RepID=UPI0023640327|nr:Rho-binding antiterminator [Pseudomonas aeruginosa]MDD1831229.1 transcriptional antiterminator [Pseudomonas aeruginosa]
MDSYHPIACDLHDYLEIACLYRYRLLLELEDGVRFEAEARTTHTRAVRPGGGKEEYLEVAVEGATLLLRLDRLLAITACGFHADSDTHSTRIRTVIPR